MLDLTRVRSGPTCVRQLADWGANVIKIDALLEDGGGEQPGGPRQGSDFQNLHATDAELAVAKRGSVRRKRPASSRCEVTGLSLYRNSGGGERSNTSPFGRSSTSSA